MPPWHPAKKTRRAFGHPIKERPQPLRPTQGLDRMERSRQFRFGKARVNFLVADVVQQNHLTAFAALQLGHQMVQTLRDVRGDRAQA